MGSSRKSVSHCHNHYYSSKIIVGLPFSTGSSQVCQPGRRENSSVGFVSLFLALLSFLHLNFAFPFWNSSQNSYSKPHSLHFPDESMKSLPSLPFFDVLFVCVQFWGRTRPVFFPFSLFLQEPREHCRVFSQLFVGH